MKTNISKPITSEAEAKAYLESLVANKEAYYLNSNSSFLNSLPQDEIKQLHLRMEEVHYFITKPITYMLQVMQESVKASYSHFNEQFEGQDPEYYDNLLN